MTNEEIVKELNNMWKQIYGIQEALSKYFENAHATSTDSISEDESTIVDLEIEIEKLKEKVGE